MNHEQLVALATKLGIGDISNLSDEDLSTKISEAVDANLELVSELNVATATATEQLAFAQAYPEQAERLRKLEERDQEYAASTFAESLADFSLTEGEGETAKSTTFRLSTLAQSVVKESHIKLAQGNLQPADLKNLIATVATGGVQQGEVGSSRQKEYNTTDQPTGNVRNDRLAFAQKVEELMTNDGMTRKAAIAEAGERYPELAKAYLGSGR